MASNLMFAMIGRAATPDSTLIFCTTIALLAFVVGVRRETWRGSQHSIECPLQPIAPQSWWSFAAMYVAMALAVLAKGPVGVVLPIAAIGGFVLFEGSRLRRQAGQFATSHSPPTQPEYVTLGSTVRYYPRWLLWRLRSLARDIPAAVVVMRPLTLIVAMLVVAVPWYAWVAIRTHGQWWHDFFWEHNVQRFMTPREGHHGLVLWPPLTFMACFFPGRFSYRLHWRP